ncbi:Phosphomutase-like protein 3 [Naviculisporaceae sp. PSN 640]
MASMIRWLAAVALVGTALPGLHTVVSGEEVVTFRYSTHRGDFIQEDPAINANPPDYTKVEYGLIDSPYPTDTFNDEDNLTKWQRYTRFINYINRYYKEVNSTYKLLYLSRHGEAWHNVATSYYGSKCWDCYWSQQDGNGTTTWRDAELTPKGVAQVGESNKFWAETVPAAGIPFPGSFYVSPMARTLATANLTFGSILPVFAPTVKETLRETINQCTCAWRHPKSWIHERYPSYLFEPGFAEEDQLFTGESIESASAQSARVRRFLDDIFLNDKNTFVSVVTHGVNVGPMLEIIGHPNPKFNLTTGQSIAVLVKADKVVLNGTAAVDPPTPAEVCGVCGPV